MNTMLVATSRLALLLAAVVLSGCGGSSDPLSTQPLQADGRAMASDADDEDDDHEDEEEGGAGPSCQDQQGMLMNDARKSALAVGMALALTACGGGGEDTAGAGSTPPPPPAQAPIAPQPNAAVANEVVLQLNVGADIDALAAGNQMTKLEQFGRRPIWRLRVAPGANVDTVVAALRNDTRVRFAEPNAQNETPEGRRGRVWAAGGDAGVFAAQWAPSALGLPTAHTVSTGANMRVAVLDTGIDLAHPAFANRLARTTGGAVLGRDFVDDDADPSEGGSRADLGYGHGTHVAGLVSLVAPSAKLMPVRVLDAQGRGNVWVLSEALAWAVDPDGNPSTDDGAHVINLSLGTTRQTNLLRTAVALANCDFDDDDNEFEDAGFDDDRVRCDMKFGAVVLAAAGNDGSATEQQFPAAEAVPGSLSIGASTQTSRLASFSNSGSWVELAAPGENIVSAVPGGGYGTWSGTSMATPLAAGVAALTLATYADPRSVKPLDITNRLVARSALLCGTPLRRVDAAGAVFDTQAADPTCN